jgi:hypothetical protein
MTQQQDSEFDAYLRGDSVLSDAYGRLPQDGPPAHIDRAILAEARHAVGSRRRRSAWRKWSVPLSVAATLSVAVLVGLEQRYLPRDEIAPPGMPAPAAPSASPVVPVPQEMGNTPADKGRETFSARRNVAPAPRAQASRPEQRAAPAAPAAGAVAKPEAPSAARPMQDDMQMQRAPVGSGLVPPAQTEAAQETQARAKAAGKAPASLGETPVAAPPAAGAQESRAQALLARIRQLKQEGRLEEARKELAAFRKRYPAYSLPPDLRELSPAGGG